MFIKIKLEPREVCSDCNKNKESLDFELPSDANIAEMKLQIEKCIKIPVEAQEIKSLTKTLQNQELISKNWDSSNGECTIVLLCSTYNARGIKVYEEPKFLCFINLYDTESDLRENLEKHSKYATYKNNSSPGSSVTLVENESDQEETLTIPPLSAIASSMSSSEKQQNAKSSVKSHATNEIPPKSVTNLSTTVTANKSKSPTVTSSSNATEKHPIVNVAPEKRAFMIVISRNCNNSGGDTEINEIDTEKLLNLFFDKFQQAGNSANLQFAENSAFTLFEGDIWIACDNSSTTEWLLANIIDFPKQYRVQRYQDFLQKSVPL